MEDNNRAIGYILRGFMIGEIKVSTVIECKRRCVIGANCLSLNILTNADGSFVCQLNSERKESGVKEQFVSHGAGEYYGLKEKKLCEDNGKSCDSATPWHAFNQSYFKLVDSPVNFHDAMKFCRAEKGDLASISSEEEQRYLHKTFWENTGLFKWVGLNDIAEDGVYVWTDGSP
ncbi:brevican core, partial [Paramuricea clavata]